MEEAFKIPILPAPLKKSEEAPLEEKKIDSECPYNVPVSKLN